MNAPLQRDRLRQRGQDGLFDRRPHRRLAEHGAARNCPRRIRSSPSSDKLILETPPTSKRSLVYHAGDHARGDADRFRSSAPRSASALAVAIVSVRVARTLADAVDRRLADGADHRAGADDRRHPQPVRHRRHDAESGDRGLSLVLSDHRRDGEGPALARSAAARSHAHLFGDVGADAVRSCARPRACRSSSPA